MHEPLVSTSSQHIRAFKDDQIDLEGVIVLDSTTLGPAAGGCRFWTYTTSDDMLYDAQCLAQGMSYKNAIAGLPLGGGKAVMRRSERQPDRAALFKAFGCEVSKMGGRYITAEDVGTTVADMQVVAENTQYVAGLPKKAGRPGGDPSPLTAQGVFLSMAVAVEHRLGRALEECSVAIQGVGHVGESLARMLHASGARLFIADLTEDKVRRLAAELSATPVSTDEILHVAADVIAPCALGGVLDVHSIKAIRASVICGAANNQLATAEIGDLLVEQGVLFAPDYVVNAGGIINVAAEYFGWTKNAAQCQVEATGDRLRQVLSYSQRRGIAPNRAADEMACALMDAAAV